MLRCLLVAPGVSMRCWKVRPHGISQRLGCDVHGSCSSFGVVFVVYISFWLFPMCFHIFSLVIGVIWCFFSMCSCVGVNVDHVGFLFPLVWPLFVGLLFLCCVRGLLTIVDSSPFDAFYICIFLKPVGIVRLCDVFCFFYLFCYTSG